MSIVFKKISDVFGKTLDFFRKTLDFFPKTWEFFSRQSDLLIYTLVGACPKTQKRQGFLPIGRKLCLQFVLTFSSALGKTKLVLGMVARCTSPFVQLTLLLLQLLPSGLVHLLLQAHNEFVEQRENL